MRVLAEAVVQVAAGAADTAQTDVAVGAQRLGEVELALVDDVLLEGDGVLEALPVGGLDEVREDGRHLVAAVLDGERAQGGGAEQEDVGGPLGQAQLGTDLLAGQTRLRLEELVQVQFTGRVQVLERGVAEEDPGQAVHVQRGPAGGRAMRRRP